ncbi:hypothetical protein C8T65DRAFT_706716 [Cerioporus squamosus]|nr:hypothetical protein C8T65DRAFT_706716 [Cerioporus squamosus]
MPGGSQIQWGPCDPSVVNDTSLSCGFLEVPLDYQDPSVGNARLAIVKVNATGERRGSLLFNPGGPGGSGLGTLVENKELLLALTGGVYDVVSWDPRGVGNLTTVHLFLHNGTIELTGIEETGNFTDPTDVQTLLAQGPTMQKKYESSDRMLKFSSGKYLKYVGTSAAVRDMVSIANVLDGADAPINYLGVSYGTLIGSWFVNTVEADSRIQRVGRVILDAVLDPIAFATQDPALSFSNQLVSVDTIYKALITGCALTGPAGCAAASEGDGPLDIDAKVNASVPITSGNIRAHLYVEMYSPADWSNLVNEDYPQIVQIILALAALTIIGYCRLVKRGSESNDSPSYTDSAIYCGDSIDARGTTMEEVFKHIIPTARNLIQTSRVVGSIWPILFYRCSSWPVRSVERYQGPFNKKLANKILIASNTFDPVTPLPAAERVAGLLGQDAVLVRQNGFGHPTVTAPSAYMNDIFIAYMTNGTVDTDFEVFDGVNTADILSHIPSTDV